MKNGIRIAAIATLLLFVGAESSTKPTTRPSVAKQVSWKSVVRDLPKEFRPPKGAEWTFSEREAAGKWVAKQLDGTKISLRTTYFDWVNSDSRDANYKSESIDAYGVRWNIIGFANFSPRGKDRASRLRDDNTIGLRGVAKSNAAGAANAGEVSVEVELSEADAE